MARPAFRETGQKLVCILDAISGALHKQLLLQRLVRNVQDVFIEIVATAQRENVCYRLAWKKLEMSQHEFSK